MVQLENIKLRLKEDYELSFQEALDLWIEIDNMDKAVLEVKKITRRYKRTWKCKFKFH